MDSDSENEQNVPDDVREAIINDYRNSQRARRDMERAVRDVDVLLMSPSEKYATAMRKFVRNKKQWKRRLGRMIRDYRRVMLRTPHNIRQLSEKNLQNECPYLIASAPDLRTFASRVAAIFTAELVNLSTIEMYLQSAEHTRDGDERSEFLLSLVEEANALFEIVLTSALGLNHDVLPHPTIQRSLVPGFFGDERHDNNDDDEEDCEDDGSELAAE